MLDRVKFTFIISVLLIAAFAFAATPAMAITMIEVSGAPYKEGDTNGNPPTQDEGIVVTLKLNVDADPELTAEDFTEDGITPLISDANASIVFAKIDAKTYTLTNETSDESEILFELAGYELNQNFTINVDRETPLTQLQLAAGYIAGNGYAIIATYRNKSADGSTGSVIASGSQFVPDDPTVYPEGDSFPTLPTIAAPYEIVRSAWTSHSDVPMPDLYAHFQIGSRGTIDLKVTSDGTTRVSDVNSKAVVINEVMWARDESQVGSEGYTREQWIEIYNTKTAPIALENIRLTLSNANPAPTQTSTDRLSNNPDYVTVWDIDGKGQNGNSKLNALKEFISMHRTNLENGWTDKHWNAATELFLPNYKGTPGIVNSAGNLPSPRKLPDTDTPDMSGILINEIGNLTGNADDWIELKNISNSPKPLNNWALSVVTGYDTEEELYKFPDKSISAGGVLLVVNKDPSMTDIAVGNNINLGAADQAFGADGNVSYLVVDNKIKIPDDNNWLLILRSGKPWEVKYGTVYNSGHNLEDVAGPGAFPVKDINTPNPRKEKKPDGADGENIWQTTLFPMNGRDESGDKLLNHDRDLSDGKVWERNTSKHGWRRHAFSQVGFTGIGYDRSIKKDDAHGGTPGYDNGVVKGKVSDIVDGRLIISELMLTNDNGSMPQWIELHNTSRTKVIDLSSDSSKPETGWQMIIENHNSGSWQVDNRPLHVTINLKDFGDIKYIPPNQTVLIVSRRVNTLKRSDYIAEHRIASVLDTQSIANALGMKRNKSLFLNAAGGFYIKIVDGDGNVTDEVGNLDGQDYDIRRGIGVDDAYSWNWPTDMTEDGRRSSLIRLMDGGTRGVQAVSTGTAGTPRVAVPDRSVEGDMTGAVLPMGTEWRGAGGVGSGELSAHAKYAGAAWVHAADTAFVNVIDSTYYGDNKDISTPLHTAGTPLPVSLSLFRPILKNSEVVIQWTTESELDNAGFNIFRSDTRDGEYNQVNDAMIQGAGTTGERTSYKWVDATAKPGLIYYYQIEDVSFAGERQTLATTKLKGLISAKNKLATTWGDLKSQN